MHGNIMRARSIPEERGVTAPTLARRRRTSPGRIRVQAARASTLGVRTLRLRLRRELEEPRRARGSPIAPVASRARPSRGGALRVEHGPSPTGPNRAEAKALADNADLIVQVLSIRDTTGELGWSFRVSVRQLKQGRLIAELATSAEDPEYEREFVATDSGFARRALDPADVGEKLARETLSEIDQRARRGRRAPLRGDFCTLSHSFSGRSISLRVVPVELASFPRCRRGAQGSSCFRYLRDLSIAATSRKNCSSVGGSHASCRSGRSVGWRCHAPRLS